MLARFTKPIVLAVGLLATLPVAEPVFAQGLAGAYLAGNQANRDNNYEAAAQFYAEALARDPNNPYLLQNALLAYVAKGDVGRAIGIAHKVAAGQFGSLLADLILISESVQNEDYAEAQAIIDDGGDRLDPLLAGLLTGWIALGDGKMTAAVERFDAMSEPQTLYLYAQYNKALALASVGDFATADRILRGDKNGHLRLNRGSLIAHAQIMSQLDKRDEALELLDSALQGGVDVGLKTLRDAIEDQGVVDFDYITDAKHGTAEVFLTLANVWSEEQGDRYALVFARLADYLRPGRAEAALMTAEILQGQQQHDLAVKAYAKVPQDDPMFLNAELGRAEALVEAGKADAAIEVLRGLTRSHNNVPQIHMSLGDVLRGQEHYAESAKAYDVAIEMISDPAPNHWFLFYARGICHEREGEWDLAEADFRQALKLNPGQPLVLNYLGYSMVEEGIKLDEAQKMIEQAVKARPEDGFIADSLGWVYYRLGKFEDAVAPMENAVQFVPNDPVINDHLGDVYWMVGRKREAEFQWRRALSFEAEEKDAVIILRKLEVGLDAVKEAEQAEQAVSGNDD